MPLVPSNQQVNIESEWDPFRRFEMQLRNSHQESVTVYKSSMMDVEFLPSRYARDELAKAMLEAGYITSWRDDRPSKSLHIIEYTDRYELHLDEHNPRYPHRQLLHLIQDAPKIGLAFVAFCLVMAYLIFRWTANKNDRPRRFNDTAWNR